MFPRVSESETVCEPSNPLASYPLPKPGFLIGSAVPSFLPFPFFILRSSFEGQRVERGLLRSQGVGVVGVLQCFLLRPAIDERLEVVRVGIAWFRCGGDGAKVDVIPGTTTHAEGVSDSETNLFDHDRS